MAQINLLRKSVIKDDKLQSYRLNISATSTNDITPYIFVNQRIRNYSKQTFDDVFRAIATPTQLEDFPQDAPTEGTSFFRTNSIDVISRNADYLEDVFQDVVNQVQKLVSDLAALTVLVTDGTYQITDSNITIV